MIDTDVRSGSNDTNLAFTTNSRCLLDIHVSFIKQFIYPYSFSVVERVTLTLFSFLNKQCFTLIDVKCFLLYLIEVQKELNNQMLQVKTNW